jgi:hypothetical protein
MTAHRTPLALVVALVAVAATPQLVAAQPPRPVAVQRASSPPARLPLAVRSKRFALESLARSKTLALRAATLPAMVPPFNRIARYVAHGEPLLGWTPKSAVDAARANARRGLGTVVGRLSGPLADRWSIAGAERSYVSLIDQLAAAKRIDAKVDGAIALDAGSFGDSLAGASAAERAKLASDGILRVARHARNKGVAFEMDANKLEDMDLSYEIAARVATTLRMPVRLAIPARHVQSEQMLLKWAGLAARTKLKLGVRLVKGSYVEPDADGAINLRRPLLAHYKKMITLALERAPYLDVVVATQNLEIFEHAQRESARLDAPYDINVIRGVNPEVQARMRAAGKPPRREYVSYGVDAPSFGLMELYENAVGRRAIAAQGHAAKDID